MNWKFLLENGANVNAIDEYGDTPLHLTLWSDDLNTEIIKVLLEFGADFKKNNENGESPLDISISSESDALNNIIDHMRKLQSKETKSNIKPLNFTL